ncbi:MAG: hypothetical protein L0L39_06565 [Atopostipes suicloacalis]|nr:hypothetical protein [Atopostipes suicloacalis]
MNNKKNSLDYVALFKFLATAFFVFHFVFITFENALMLNSKSMMLSIIVLFLISIIGLIKEFGDVQRHNQKVARQYSILEKIEIISTFAAASFLTYIIQTVFNQNSIFAASAVSLLMVYLIPHTFKIFEITVYTGTITGMAEAEFIHNWPLALAFAFLSGLFYLIFQPSFRATGGRAGLMAYISSMLFLYLFLDWEPGIGAQINPDMLFLTLLLIFAGAFATYFLQKNNVLSVVKSAMIVTLFFDLIFPESLHLYAVAAFLVTIVAMTTPSKLKNLPFLTLIAFIAFLFFVYSFPLLAGTTGKLGLVALTAFLSADGISILVELLKQKTSAEVFKNISFDISIEED